MHEEYGPAKTAASVRDLPIAAKLKQALAEHLARTNPGPDDVVFPDCQDNDGERTVWDRICRAARIHNATPRDTRHTFGVHAAMAGIPAVEIQDLMGHTSLSMTMRYMRFAPSASRMDENAERIAAHMEATPEADERRRESLKGA